MKNKVLFKLVLTSLIPTFGMLFFSSIYIYNKYKALENLRSIDSNINYRLNAKFLLNNIQKERGISAGFIGSKGEKFIKELKHQRTLTNESKAIFENFILKNSFANQNTHIKKIQEKLFYLEKIRKEVDELKLTLNEELKAYNQITNSIINSMNILQIKKQNSQIDNKLQVLLYLVNIKEFAGLERAMLSNTFSKKNLQKEDYNKIIEFISLQKNNIESLKNITTIEDLDYFYKTYNSKLIENMQSFRKKIYNFNNLQIEDSDAKLWWELSTKRIDALGEVIEYFVKKVLNNSNFLKDSIINSLIYSFILWIVSIAASIFSIIAIKNIVKKENISFKNLKKQKKMYNILNHANELIIYNYTMEEVLHKACSFATKELELSLSFICLLNKDKLQIVESSGEKKEVLSKLEVNDNSKIYKKSLIERKNIIINNIIKDKSSIYFSTEKISSIKSIAIYPLYKKDEAVGIMAFCSNEENYFDEEIITIFDKMTNDLSYGLEKEENEKLRLEYEEELRIASYSFDSQEAMTITDANANIVKVNSSFTKITGYEKEEVIGKNPKILKSGKHSDEFYQKMWKDLLTYGSWSGEIYNKRKNGEIYPERATITAIKNNMGKTTHYIAQFFDITEIKDTQEKLIKQVQTDSLTGLFNRTVLNDRLSQAIASANRTKNFGALIFIDLDNFKYINDSLGHDIGDLFLIKIANIIKSNSREDDIVIRLGGDEFVILLQNLSSQKTKAIVKVESFANKIRDVLDNPIQINQHHKLTTTSSIGIALFPEKNKCSIDIVKNADSAMYLSKEKGKNRVMFYHEDLDKKTKNFLKIENELRAAIKREQFELHYQNKFDLKNNKIIGFEALLRWIHPTKGIVHPNYFLEVAQKSDLIIQIGRGVIKEVIKQIKIWQKEEKFKDIKISINISSIEFEQVDFIEFLENIIQEHKINTKYLEFEINESYMFKDLNFVIKRIKELKKLGISCSIDGVGISYTSFDYIYQVPVDTIKLDKSFLRKKDKLINDAIINMIVEISQKLNLNLIIEGVENKEELEYLKTKNSHIYQGYYFSKPLKANDVIKLLNKK